MGNTLGGKKTTKIMKINGETIKLKTPVQAGQVTKDYPGFVLLESEAVKHFGIRAKPLGLHQELKPRRLYFLVELPKFPEEKAPRKVRSGINMTAKDRLDSLLLARRSISDLSLLKGKSSIIVEEQPKGGPENDKMRLKMRLPKAEVERVMRESKTEAEAAEKIMKLCLSSSNKADDGENDFSDSVPTTASRGGYRKEGDQLGRVREGMIKKREKRVGFLPVKEGEIQLAVA